MNNKKIYSQQLYLYHTKYPYKNFFKNDSDDYAKIEEYLKYKKTRKANGVIYTCITNNYDDIEEIKTHTYINKDWDYVCFTDNNKHIAMGQIGIWTILPLQYEDKENPTKTSRWHKLHPHILLKKYKESIFLDANINILSNKLFNDINKSKKSLLIPKHFCRNCIYEEFDVIEEERIDNVKIVKKQHNFIQKEGMPKNYGLNETNIIFRKHHKKEIIDIMETWWEIIKSGSKRDQLSLSYVLWKNNIKVNDISMDNARTDWANFYIFDHKGQFFSTEIQGKCNKNAKNNKLNLHFMIPACGREFGSTRIRILNLVDELSHYFNKVTVGLDIPKDTDIIIFQKVRMIKELEQAKNEGKFVCFDTDDYFLYYRTMIQKSDFIITSTEYLKEIMLDWNSNIEVVENCLDIDDYNIPLKRKTKSNKKQIKVGWFGYSDNSIILKLLNIYDNVTKISDNGDIPYDTETIDCELKKFDYIIIPQEKTDKTLLCKTHNRMLKALYLGIPTIVSDLPEYVRLAELVGYPKEYILSDLNNFKPLIEKLKNKEIDLPNIDFKNIRKIILKNYHKEIIAKDFAEKICNQYKEFISRKNKTY